MAAIAAARKDFEKACFFVGAYDAYRELIGASHETFVRDLLERLLAQASAHLEGDEIDEAKARGAELSLAEVVDRALAMPSARWLTHGRAALARLLSAKGRREFARRLSTELRGLEGQG